MSLTIDELYNNYSVLSDAKEKISEHSKEYEEIIEGVRSGEKEKQLASQVIAKFFKHFPELQQRAIEALLDICEDENIAIRKQAIRVLPLICKECKEHTAKVTDILSQLLQLNDPQEQNIVRSSLITVIANDPQTGFKSVLKQINLGEDCARARCLKFLNSKYRTFDSEIITKEIDELMVNECKKILKKHILKVSSAEEFQSAMSLLAQTRFLSTEKGPEEYVGFCIQQAELNQELDPLDKESDQVDRILCCIRTALPHFTSKIDSSKFVNYICQQVLPQFDAIATLERGSQLQMELLKQLAELSIFCHNGDYIVDDLTKILTLVKNYMPLPPDDGKVESFPHQEYSVVECLLFTFHCLLRFDPSFLSDNADRLKDFRIRLQFFARGVQGILKPLKNGTAENGNTVKHVDLKLKNTSLNVVTNINTLIKDLFHTPLSFKSLIVLSWKIPVKAIKVPAGTAKTEEDAKPKRHAPITFDDESPSQKKPRNTSNGYKNFSGPSRPQRSNQRNRNWAAKRNW